MVDDPANEIEPNESIYDAWVANRRSATPRDDLTDRVMAALQDQVEGCVLSQQSVRFEERWSSPWMHLAVCLAGLLVGSIPFLYVAYELIVL